MASYTYNGGATLTDRNGRLIGEKSEPFVEKLDSVVIGEIPLLIAAYRVTLNSKKNLLIGFTPNFSKSLGPIAKKIEKCGGIKDWVELHPVLPIIKKRISAKARKKSGLGDFDLKTLEEAARIEIELRESIQAQR